MVSERKFGWWQSLSLIAFAAVICRCQFGVKPAIAEETATRAEVPETVISGVVTNSDGKPAEGTVVCLVGSRLTPELRPNVEIRTLGQVTTDKDGRFQWRWRRLIEEYWVGIGPVAHSGDKLLGWAAGFCKVDQRSDVTISLQTMREVRGRLVDLNGMSIDRAQIRLVSLYAKQREDRKSNGCTVPEQFRDEFATTTDRDGKFVFTNVPSSVVDVGAEVESREFGSPKLTWNIEESSTFQLDRAGSVRGRIEPAPAEKILGGIHVRIYPRYSPTATPKPKLPYRVSYNTRVPIQADGSFEFKGVPPDNYEVYATFEPGIPWVPERAAPLLQVSPGESVVDLRVAVHPAVRVKGRVVEQPGGRVAAGACVTIYETVGRFRDKTIWSQTIAFTDKLGRFEAFVRAGPVFARATRSREVTWPGFSPGEDAILTKIAGESYEFPDVVLDVGNK
jgi:hypothetical protein